MNELGRLNALRAAGKAAWAARLDQCFDLDNALIVRPDDPRADEITSPDWTGFPTRVATCLTRQRALRLLDVQARDGDIGGRVLQEEYLEWRIVRDEEGLRRVELTTELAAYWEILAAHEPEYVLAQVAEFAGEDSVPTAAIYGHCDPFADRVTAEDRRQAFAQTMLRIENCSPYNDGRRAICCLIQGTNTLSALVELTCAATVLRLFRDGPEAPMRCLTCSEAIPLIGDKAQAGRSSDPVFVERLARLAYEGRLVTLDDPVGIYIASAEHTRLRTPHGDDVPPEWFVFSRGESRDEAADGRSRYQRVVLEVPPEEGFRVSDLTDVATEEKIEFGGQVADLLQLVMFLRTSEKDIVPGERDCPVELATVDRDANGCAQVHRDESRLTADAERRT